MAALEDGDGATAAPEGAPDRHLDLRGLNCPLPVLKTRKALAGLSMGSRITVEATDPMAAIDLPHLLNSEGHILEEMRREPDGLLRFAIRKGTSPADPEDQAG